MKKIKKNCFIYILLLFLYSLTVMPSILYAETGYVSDMLILSLKEGAGRQYNTIRTLRSNTPVEILETSDRFLKVKTEEGDVGWVESQYITRELPKTIIIEQLIKKIEILEQAKSDSGNRLDETSVNQSENSTNNTKNSEQYINKIKALEVALNVQLEKNKKLEEQLNQSKPVQNQEFVNLGPTTDQDNIQESNLEDQEGDSTVFSEKETMVLPDDDLLKTAMIKWFCAGAGVLIAGWFIGRTFSGGRRRGLLD